MQAHREGRYTSNRAAISRQQRPHLEPCLNKLIGQTKGFRLEPSLREIIAAGERLLPQTELARALFEGNCALKTQAQKQTCIRHFDAASAKALFSAFGVFFRTERKTRKNEPGPVFFTTRQTIENTPYFRVKSPFFRKNRFFLRKIAFFFVFPLDNAQLWGYIWLTLNPEECQ